jgi:hypothetical protein
MWVLDYSGWRPNANDYAVMRANGIVGVSRYLAPLTSEHNWKRIGKGEYDGLLANGLNVVLNWEEHADSWRGGYPAGVSAGQQARAQARALGHPDDRPLIQSIDQSVYPQELATAIGFQLGFNDGGGCGPQGCYGTAYLLDELSSRNAICVGWQTAARGWFGNAPQSANAAMVQMVTKRFPFPANLYDENICVKQDWGQMPRPANEGDCGFFHYPGQPDTP